jgi:hypothetical protein
MGTRYSQLSSEDRNRIQGGLNLGVRPKRRRWRFAGPVPVNSLWPSALRPYLPRMPRQLVTLW